MVQKGVIYILTNPSFPQYVKIGYADDVQKRLQQLNRSECTPFAFRIYATYEVDARLDDLKLHMQFSKRLQNWVVVVISCAFTSFLLKSARAKNWHRILKNSTLSVYPLLHSPNATFRSVL